MSQVTAIVPSPVTRILILGGGFGGFYAALELNRVRDPQVQVTVVSRENFLVFTPMLPEVAAGDVDLIDIVTPLRQVLRHVTFVEAEVTSIDLVARTVTVIFGINSAKKILAYDHLLIAMGSETSFFNLPGVEESALTMKSLGDAYFLRNQALAMLELASLTEDSSLRRAMLTFVVAGGGFAGVETVGALNDFVRDALRFYPALLGEKVRIVLIHPNGVILPELGESLGRYAQEKLAERSVEILTETRVTGYSARGVELDRGEPIPTRSLVWTAGVTPPSVLRGLPCAKERNRIVVDSFFSVPEYPNVWAIGDCASFRDQKTNSVQPPTAQHALRQGRLCGKNILAAVRGRQQRPFVFSTLGQLAVIGRRTGVANILGVHLSGLLAWWLWRTIYLSKLPTWEKQVRVALSWTLDLFFAKDLAQYLTLHEIDRVQRRLNRARENSMVGSASAESMNSVPVPTNVPE